jgi:hypothetical protein
MKNKLDDAQLKRNLLFRPFKNKEGGFRVFKMGDFVLVFDINFSWMIILVPSSSFDRPQESM